MFVISRGFVASALAMATGLACGQGVASQESQSRSAQSPGNAVKILVSADSGKYSMRDTLRVSASLENTGDLPVYVDRRMFWTGLGGGLQLDIVGESGERVPVRVLSDALMPPPREGDMSILVRLEPGFFYGTSIRLSIKDLIPIPGKYSIRVTYKSWLRKQWVAPQLQGLPAIWDDSPALVSPILWVEVSDTTK